MKRIVQIFDTYEKARLSFATSASDFASRMNNIDYLIKAGAIELLISMLTDPIVKIQQMAVLALGKIINASSEAISVVLSNPEALRVLMRNIEKKTKYYKKFALFTLKGLCATEEGTMAVLEENGLFVVMNCFEDFEPGVKEGCCLVLASVASHSAQLAYEVVASGSLRLLRLTLQEPELCLKQAAIKAIGEIAKHNESLAEEIINTGILTIMAKFLANPNSKLKKTMLCCMARIAYHGQIEAEAIQVTGAVEEACLHLSHPDPEVKRNASCLIREVVKHNKQLVQFAIASGALIGLIKNANDLDNSVKLPSIIALGYIGAQSPEYADAVIDTGSVEALLNVIESCTENHVTAAAIWALGHVAKHSVEHVNKCCDKKVLSAILNVYNRQNISDDLYQKCRETLRSVITRCMNLNYLLTIHDNAPFDILKYILGQYAKILPGDADARRCFVLSDGLKKITHLNLEPGTTSFEYVKNIQCCFPPEIIRYFSPKISPDLIDLLDTYVPQIPPLFSKDVLSDEIEESEIFDKRFDNTPPTQWGPC